MKKIIITLTAAMLCITLSAPAQHPEGPRMVLKENWAIKSSAEVRAGGREISTAGFSTQGWYRTAMPSTILAALEANNVISNPYYGTNFNKIPGQIANRNRGIPVDSPFSVAWWYRTEFQLPATYKGKHVWLNFHSINYKANVWLNGKLVADTTTIEGAYRLFTLDITKEAVPGGNNCLALEIFPPKSTDLSITWVDWNPTPPDNGTGIWYDVTVHATGDVSIEEPFVKTKLNIPSNDEARLTVSVLLRNSSSKQVSGKLTGKIEKITFSKQVNLNAGETKKVVFEPSEFSQLIIRNPRLWWPHNVGPQNLYDLNLSFEASGKVSDVRKVRFGIREITSWMNEFDSLKTRVFQVNGKNIVIRGGGYVQDLFLKPSNERIDADIAYAKHMNLNALRMEAPRGSDYMFDRCDEEGILLMVGWCCCSMWERWKTWTPHTADIAELSWRDQIVHLRNHPSVFVWLYGSDNYPPEDIERRYIKVLDEYDGTRPYLSSATQAASKIAGPTGVWMGPYPKVYAYFPPSYWYGKLEFNTEAGPSGEQIPPLETMRMMMPEEDLWPPSESWELRLHKNFYPIARAAFESRYGKPSSVEEYSMKAQIFQNEAVKAMFEAYAANKYKSSGIIYWMYNGAWPKMYWQLYDYFYMPNGAFYAARSACEPLHVFYSYKEQTVKIVNSLYKEFKGLKVSAKIFDFNSREVWSKTANADVEPDESKNVFPVEVPANITKVYFLKLEMKDAEGKSVSSNFYWLHADGDEKADFKDLMNLPKTNLKVEATPLQQKGNRASITVTLENTGSNLAFAVNPKILKSSSKSPVLPIFWDDNYFSLLPGEKRMVNVEFDVKELKGDSPLIKVEGWNVPVTEQVIKIK
ncbi:MAG: glycoside hydrolase family 2 TIM barrel-domain containing protein [Bacteroidales bacterium]